MFRRKLAARDVVQDWLSKNREQLVVSEVDGNKWLRPEILVRINYGNEELWRADLEAGILADGFMLPKIRRGADIERICAFISQLEVKHGLKSGSRILLPIATETAEGVVNMDEICKASTRTKAIMWGCEDLSSDVGALRNREEEYPYDYLEIFKYVRSRTLFVAKANGIQAIDGAFNLSLPVAPAAPAGSASADDLRKTLLQRETKAALRQGFDGKLVLSPSQLGTVLGCHIYCR